MTSDAGDEGEGVAIRAQRSDGSGLDDGSGLFDLFKGFEERGDVGFGGVVCDGNGFGFEVTDDVLDAFLKGYVLHDLVNTALAMEVHREDHYLLIGLCRVRVAQFTMHNAQFTILSPKRGERSSRAIKIYFFI